jgi:hypothetical protein
MKKIAVFHYMPIEYYPPTTNFLDLVSEEKDIEFKVWTTHNNKNRKVYKSNYQITINRTVLPEASSKSILRLLKYFIFNLKSLFGLLFFKPSKIIYFESFSVWPVYVYKKYFNNSVDVLIHYHEYFSPYWYENGMRLVKYYHKLESKFLYENASWISQTNDDRMAMFLKDNEDVDLKICEILPNYPPINWTRNKLNSTTQKQIKTVYIGTLSLDYSYVKEYCNWVMSKNGDVVLDIYGYNYNKETLDYLNSLDSDYIHFNEAGVEYSEIPKLLENYDVGLILYKALTENFKYNAPNKLFEYLVCNLQVWYSDKMLGVKPYDSSRVISLDFESMCDFDYNSDFKSRFNDKLNDQYTANNALKTLINKLTK